MTNVGFCEYCLQEFKDLKKVQLRANPKDKGQRPMMIGPACRKYLKGFFKYVKKD